MSNSKQGRFTYQNFSDHPNFVPIDPDKVDFIQKRLDELPEAVLPESTRAKFRELRQIQEQTLAALGNYRPATRAMFPGGIGYVQAPLVGSLVVPEWTDTSGNKEQASYPVCGTERFVINTKKIGISSDADLIDVGITFSSITVDVYGHKVRADAREVSEAAGNHAGLSVDAYKIGVADDATKTTKEYLQAQLVRTSGNYASSTYYATKSGSTQWSHASGTPVDDIAGARRTVFKGSLGQVDLTWMSGDAFTAFRRNAQVLASVTGLGSMDRPATMLSAESCVALLGMNLVIADAHYAATPGGTVAQIWGQDAGVVCTNPGSPIGVRFGVTATTSAYPYVASDAKPTSGGRGVTEYLVTDGFTPTVTKNTGGFLFINASAAY